MLLDDHDLSIETRICDDHHLNKLKLGDRHTFTKSNMRDRHNDQCIDCLKFLLEILTVIIELFQIEICDNHRFQCLC